MKETPFPFTVCATSALGASPPARKRAKAARNAAWSCPSTVSTSQPNARSFASRSPSATISSVGLSDWTSLRSTTTQSLPRRSCAAAWSASQFWPSWSSPSPGHHDDEPLPAEPALRERDPAALGDAHPERARARLDPGHADVRVPVEPAEAAEAKQALARDDAEREERRVQARHVVALGREEDVAVGIVESALGDVQLVEQELGDDVERAERRAEVAGAGALHRDERVQPARVGKERQLRVGVDVGGAQTIELGLRDEAQVRHPTGDRSRRVRPASSGVRRRRRVGVFWRPVQTRSTGWNPGSGQDGAGRPSSRSRFSCSV